MKRIFPLIGLALVAAAVTAQPTPLLSGSYFGETGCDHCDIFLYKQKAAFEAEYGVQLDLAVYDILDPEDYALCAARLEGFGQSFRIFPVLFIGNNAYQGNAAIDAALPEEIAWYLANKGFRPALAAPATDSTAVPAPGVAPLAGGFSAAPLPVLAAGLLDGINPCAFSTLLFFLSFLSLRRQRRRDILAAGAAFIAAVFAVYTALGFGLLAGLRALIITPATSLAMNVLISLIGLILGALSWRDAERARVGRAHESTLKLPLPLQRASHWAIRTFADSGWLFLGAGLCGALVSLLELACTGQIYLPTLAYINRTAPSVQGIGLLALYNLAFITPLAAVFVLFGLGMTHQKLQAWYQRHLVSVRRLTAVFFLGMAVLIWLV